MEEAILGHRKVHARKSLDARQGWAGSLSSCLRGGEVQEQSERTGRGVQEGGECMC